MQERLSKVVGRTENIVTPVEGDDIFPILHRRLFTSVGDEERAPRGRRRLRRLLRVARRRRAGVLSRGRATASGIAAAYPFHPELVDILTNRWGSLSGFQRTRGALRTLAHTVKALSQRNHQAPLIHPGDVTLADAGHPGRGPPVRRRELQGRAQRRHHPSRLQGSRGGPPPRRPGRGAPARRPVWPRPRS